MSKEENVESSSAAKPRQISIEEAFTEIGFGNFQLHVIILIGMSIACDSIETGVIVYLQACIKDQWDLTGDAEALLSASVLVGQVVGMLCSPLADKLGRRPIVISGWACIIGFGFASAASQTYWELVLLRSLVGFGIGISQTTSYDLCCELLSHKDRSKVTYVGLLNILAGIYLLVMLWLFLASLGWRFILIAAAIPVLILGVSGFFILPESPRWLQTEGRTDEAAEMVKTIAKYNQVELQDFQIKELVDHKADCIFFDLFLPKYISVTARLYVIWFFIYFAGFSLTLTFALLLKSDDTETCSYNYEGILYAGMSDFLFILMACLLIDILGRKFSQFSFFSLAGTCGLAYAFVSNMLHSSSSKTAAIILVVLGKSLIGAGLCALWIHTAELIPTELRASGHSSTVIMGRIGSIAATFWVDSFTLTSPLVGPILFSLAAVVAACVALTMKETTDTSLDTDNAAQENTPLLPTTFTEDVDSNSQQKRNDREVVEKGFKNGMGCEEDQDADNKIKDSS